MPDRLEFYPPPKYLISSCRLPPFPTHLFSSREEENQICFSFSERKRNDIKVRMMVRTESSSRHLCYPWLWWHWLLWRHKKKFPCSTNILSGSDRPQTPLLKELKSPNEIQGYSEVFILHAVPILRALVGLSSSRFKTINPTSIWERGLQIVLCHSANIGMRDWFRHQEFLQLSLRFFREQ